MFKSLTTATTTAACLAVFGACGGSADPAGSESEPATASAGEIDATTEACTADPTWISSPSLPTEIPDSGATLCDFYQFSWQSFLYLMAPTESDPDTRNFEVTSNYPIFNGAKTCGSDRAEKPQLFLRVTKDFSSDPDFRLPESTGQAGGGATIYDQNGNVAYYSVLISEDLCEQAQGSDPTSGNLPANAIEMKFAWKVLEVGEEVEYVTIDAVIGDDPTITTLGMTGMHLVQSTPSHPEMVWASFEFQDNVSDCLDAASPPSGGYDYQSNECNACLANPTQSCLDSCAFNKATPASSLTGPPSEICRLFPDGTDLADSDNNGQTNPDGTKNNDGQQNIADVDAMNEQLVGPNGLLAQLSADDPLRVLAGYRNLGAIWVTNPQIAASASSNQRGSLQLENPVAETVFQGTLSLDSSGQLTASSDKGLNCFSCHDYQPGKTASSGLSHVYSSLIPSTSGSE